MPKPAPMNPEMYDPLRNLRDHLTAILPAATTGMTHLSSETAVPPTKIYIVISEKSGVGLEFSMWTDKPGEKNTLPTTTGGDLAFGTSRPISFSTAFL